MKRPRRLTGRLVFAPGTVDGPHRRRRFFSAGQVDAIGRALLYIAALAALAATLCLGTLCLAAAYLHLGGLLP